MVRAIVVIANIMVLSTGRALAPEIYVEIVPSETKSRER